jgi:hypothetical protein
MPPSLGVKGLLREMVKVATPALSFTEMFFELTVTDDWPCTIAPLARDNTNKLATKAIR